METGEKINIYIIGYMGTGKTTIGQLLAIKLKRDFFDVDGFIENRYHKTVTEIFEEKGESGFREIEHRIIHEISEFENVVVSTGGGLPCFFDNMEIMNRTGITVYLKSSVEELIRRINLSKQKRPLIKGKSPEELQDFVEINLKKRESFYSQAKFTFDVPHFSSKQEMNLWVEEILKKIGYTSLLM